MKTTDYQTKMAKFLKSIFTPEKRKSSKMEAEAEEDRSDFTPPLDGRRKLSISRSGRMKQAYKKRHELSMELYGEDMKHEKPKHMDYHVNKAIDPAELRRHSLDNSSRIEEKSKEQRRSSTEDTVKTPEEEIESAFEIIDKVL